MSEEYVKKEIALIIEIREKNENFPNLTLETIFLNSYVNRNTYNFKDPQHCDKPFKENFSVIDNHFRTFPDSQIYLTMEKPDIIQIQEFKLFLYEFWKKEKGGPEIE